MAEEQVQYPEANLPQAGEEPAPAAPQAGQAGVAAEIPATGGTEERENLEVILLYFFLGSISLRYYFELEILL